MKVGDVGAVGVDDGFGQRRGDDSPGKAAVAGLETNFIGDGENFISISFHNVKYKKNQYFS